jgi:formate C-acetyltransferase
MKRCEFEKYWPWMAMSDGVDSTRREELVRRLESMNEFYAAGFFAQDDASLYRRYAAALRNVAKNMPLMKWKDTLLFPTTSEHCREWQKTDKYCGLLWNWHEADVRRRPVLGHFYSMPWSFDWGVFYWGVYNAKLAAVPAEDRWALETIKQFQQDRLVWPGGFTHCTVNYERVLREGLNGYRRSIEAKMNEGNDEQRELYESLLIIIETADIIRRRLVEEVERAKVSGEELNRKIRLITALERVPFEPARDFYEAMVAVNFVFYFDGCDSPGRMDQYLLEYYRRDRAAGKIDDAFVIEILREFWINMDRTEAWNVAIGGRGQVNELTYLILESVKGLRRPNLALRVPEDAEDRLWDAAFASLATGNGLPAIYNDSLYTQALRDYGLGLSEKDLRQISYGGCTETMIQGCSNVGSLAGNLHMLIVLERTMNKWLDRVKTYEEFYRRFLEELDQEIDGVCDEVDSSNEIKAKLFPQMIRTLLVDDCVEHGREFYRGGARYNWEVIGLEGFSNVVDSLYTLKTIVFDQGEMTGRKFKQIVNSNFVGYEDTLSSIRKLPKYGQGKEEVDQIAKQVATFTFDRFHTRAAWRGGKFLPACLMFTTYVDRGKLVGATPDGRLAQEPLGDSFGAYQGRDKKGPTALLNSVTSFPHLGAPGTLVVNARFGKEMMTSPATRRKLQQLIETYFSRGGMQIQMTVVDQKILEEAIAHPEAHEDLIVRIGGFSVYFNDMSNEMKRSVLERSIHEL